MLQKDNPCLACSLDQKCCKAEGLKLTRREFEEHFQPWLHQLSVIEYKGISIVYPRDGRPCPHWREDGCAIYEQRPIDCRLFPFELRTVAPGRSVIRIHFNDQTDCPLKEELFLPVEEAKELMRTFAREAYGARRAILFEYAPGARPRRPFGFFDALVARIYRFLRQLR